MQADFYVISDSNSQAKYPLLCRLTEKAYLDDQKVYIHAAHEQEAKLIDQLLWTYRDDSFIPHLLTTKGQSQFVPIQIGFDNPSEDFNEILINLSFEIPHFFNRFKRIIEIVWQDENSKQASRTHFKNFRESGYELRTFKVS